MNAMGLLEKLKGAAKALRISNAPLELSHNLRISYFYTFKLSYFILENFILENFILENFILSYFILENFIIENFILSYFILENFILENFTLSYVILENFKCTASTFVQLGSSSSLADNEVLGSGLNAWSRVCRLSLGTMTSQRWQFCALILIPNNFILWCNSLDFKVCFFSCCKSCASELPPL